MKKLFNPILKYFGLQLVKRPKQRRTNLKGWKQQGRGTGLTISDATESDMQKIMIDSNIARLARYTDEHNAPLNQLTKNYKIPKGAKQGVPVLTKTKRRKYTKHESTIGPFTKQSKNIIIKAMGLEEKK